ncbi:MAG TPA: ribosome maturation factor RimM [Bryobacteraceae bacterium]
MRANKVHSECVVDVNVDGWVYAGRLIRARGNRGEFVAEVYSAQPGRAGQLKVVRLEKKGIGRLAQVERVWHHNGRPILKFAGIDSISEAETWEGADVLVDASARVLPVEGEYSYADLIGCAVLREDGEAQIGVVRGIEEYGGSVLLTVAAPDGREILIPFARSMCREIDTQRKRIRAWLPQGLDEL